MKPPVISSKYNTSQSTEEETNSEESTETTEEEDTSEETEEETEDTESESEEEEESDTSEEGEDKPQYLDLKNVPPQLQAAAKKMLATHTKTIQKLHKKYEEQLTLKTQELQEEYSQVIVKGAGFDKIIKLPGWEKFWEDVQNGNPYGYSSDFRKNGKDSSEEEDSSAEAGGKTLSADALAKSLMPSIRKMIDDAVGPFRTERANNVWADAEKNLPNFPKYKARVTEILTKHPTLSIQDAYERASEKDRVNDAVQKALKDAQETSKKIPKTLKPGTASGGKREIDKKTVDSIDKALNLARHDLIGATGG